MADKYIPDLAQRLGLTYAPWAKTFKTDQQQSKGAAIGVRNKFLVSLALVSAGNNRSVGIAVRYPRLENVAALAEELKSQPAFKTFTGRKALQSKPDMLTVGWPYTMKKPKPEEIVALVDSLLATVAKYASPFDGKCEDCHSSTTSEITLKNGIPGYHCLACQERLVEEQRRVQQEYRSRNANYLMAVLMGVAVALAAGAIWGLFVGFIDGDGKTWTPKLHMLGSIVIGGALSYVFFRAAGKIDRVGQVLAILLTIAGKWWADSIYYAMLITHQHLGAITPVLMSNIIRHFWELKFDAEMSTLVFAGDIGFAFIIPWMPWGKIPKFIPQFQPLAGDGTAKAATA